MLPIDGSGHPIPKPPMLSHHDQTCIMLDLEWGGVDTVLQYFAKLYASEIHERNGATGVCLYMCTQKCDIHLQYVSLSLHLIYE